VVDPKLLLRRVFGWPPYFAIEEYLSRCGDPRIGAFRRAVRRYAELYVLEVLASLAPDAVGVKRLYTEEDLRDAYAGQGVKLADAVLDYGDTWVVLDVSTRRLMRDSVAGLSHASLQRDVRALAGAKAEQLESTIEQLRRDESRLTGEPARAGRHFAPLVVATEGFPVNPSSSLLVEEHLRAVGQLAAPDVLPLQIVDVVELEMVEGLQESGGPSLAQLLTAKPRASLSRSSLRDYVLVECGLTPRRPARLTALWLSATDQLASLVRPAA
jgi:hypothetical protein